MKDELLHKYYIRTLKRIINGTLTDAKEIEEELASNQKQLLKWIDACRVEAARRLIFRSVRERETAQRQRDKAAFMATMLQTGSDDMRKMVKAFLAECPDEPAPDEPLPGYEFVRNEKPYRIDKNNNVVLADDFIAWLRSPVPEE